MHEDERRTLYEIPGGAVCKAIIAKEGCALGNHWHAKKTESFLLLTGWANEVTIGDLVTYNIPAPCEWVVPPGTFHVFDLKPGSILIGTASEPFDPEDEIKGKPNE